jgi:hypothetical protein
MVPVSGGRRELTELDVATLADIGWEIELAIEGVVIGDANNDGCFDRADLVHVLQSGRYLAVQPVSWGDGDWNGDGWFDSCDIIRAL